RTGPNYASSVLQVNAGGRLIASNSTFAWSSLTLANVVNSGDLTGNGFDQTISVLAINADKLVNNRRFQAVNILAGSLSGVQTATLAPLGIDTQLTQRYVFNSSTGSFTVQAGATLNVSSGATVEA